ncbi:DUF1289 domain-containing protein [Aestuariibacter sp. AA17]|uniref:DUF1289 domain-containing protein n=1 Tax=Fluctibacter corallii TaxID=2984329 RepID=A0ABT3A459_9ALTE|nr:DUF1289 domain-containing protein [Aestuariibacter sp. AA17]MCV2883469.1 DUF1289 domain-containing protein [Aestuariibacter sp. AA17]
MNQLEFFDIPSPCIGVCESGPKGYCIGCYRSREERLYWHQLNDDTKRIVIQACHRRRKRAEAATRKKAVASPQIQKSLWGDDGAF